eukprot:CAMPEP_0185903112 /NCGR_PEP_ID=MMETSP0196C-20130402/2324_1 /TAXON_ID=2932 /ORGANISM="Alexandrium fundyense, Strain CCMP1719" /LENGTH=95 /DNA_ID=CAMNT_0028622091 /DNA_START=94 /DNA_END=379 /DNA_ORIENTATION=+
MGVPHGFFAPGLITGTITFAIIGAIGSFAALTCFAQETPNITKGESRRLGVFVVVASAFCMWLIWACIYMHQLVPIITPEHVYQAEIGSISLNVA